MRILITGGCGFLGSNLASHALKRGDRVAIFDDLSRKGSKANLEWLRKQGGFAFRHMDIRNAGSIGRVVRDLRPDAVFHLAGQVAMTVSIAHPMTDFEINSLGTLNLLEAVRKHAPKAIVIYSSTNKVYGDLEWVKYTETRTRYKALAYPHGFDESIPLDFRSPYGCSKGAADQYMLDYARIYGLRTVVFRHSSMYGGRQFSTYDQGWIGWFCRKALETKLGKLKEPFTISGTGKQVRDVLHSRDMIDLYFTAVGRIGRICGQAFNIGGGMKNSLSLLELFSMLEGLTGVRLKYERLPPRSSDQQVFVADMTKAKRLIGWEPKVTAGEGIKNMLEWVGSI